MFQINTTFEEFATIVCEDNRSATLDAGNVKLTYNVLLEKAEAREKERLKEEVRKQKKLESAFRSLLKDNAITVESTWENTRSKIENEQAFQDITLESERQRIFTVNFTFYKSSNVIIVYQSTFRRKNLTMGPLQLSFEYIAVVTLSM